MMSEHLRQAWARRIEASESDDDSRLSLYRGEGSHDRPSYYPTTGPDAYAGAWWTSDLAKARNYAAGAGEGAHVYHVKVHPHESEPRGLPGYHFIADPLVRARRTLLE